MLAEGCSADSLDDSVEMGESTILKKSQKVCSSCREEIRIRVSSHANFRRGCFKHERQCSQGISRNVWIYWLHALVLESTFFIMYAVIMQLLTNERMHRIVLLRGQERWLERVANLLSCLKLSQAGILGSGMPRLVNLAQTMTSILLIGLLSYLPFLKESFLNSPSP